MKKYILLCLLIIIICMPCMSQTKRSELKKDNKLSFAFLTDIHQNFADEKTKQCHKGLLQALAKVKKTDAEFIMLGGDLVDVHVSAYDLTKKQVDSMYLALKKAMDKSGLPYHAAIGNHDRYFDKSAGYTAGDEVFKTFFGPSYYTFEQKGIRFFVLNSVQPSEKYDLTVGDEQLKWLKQELIKVPVSTPIVVITHVPFFSVYWPAIEGKFVSWDIIYNYREVLAAFKEHNLKLVLQGHQHIYEEIYTQNVQYITGGAVCASWWNGAFHGTEEGFLLVHVDKDDQFKWEYIDMGWDVK